LNELDSGGLGQSRIAASPGFIGIAAPGLSQKPFILIEKTT
jgi:hypothetical protein